MTTPNDAPTALKLADSHLTWPGDMCLNHTWNCYGKNYGYADALAAWRATTVRKADMNPPAGVPVYFSASYQPHGHVVISRGGGMVRSTDWKTFGLVGDVNLAYLIDYWNLEYLGWSPTFCGDPIANIPGTTQLPPEPAPIPAPPTLKVGVTAASVKLLEAGLIRCFPSYSGNLANDGANTYYGTYTRDVVSEFQRRSGLYVDGICGPKTWAALGVYGILWY